MLKKYLRFWQILFQPSISPNTPTLTSEMPLIVQPEGLSVAAPVFPPVDGTPFLGIEVDLNGALWIRPAIAIGPVSGAPPSDGIANPATPMDVTAFNMIFNGVTWDRASGSDFKELITVTGNRVFIQANPAVTNVDSIILGLAADRRYFLIQNKDPVGNVYVVFGAAATVALGVKILPGGSLELTNVVSNQDVHAIGDIANNINVVIVSG